MVFHNRLSLWGLASYKYFERLGATLSSPFATNVHPVVSNDISRNLSMLVQFIFRCAAPTRNAVNV